MSVVSDAGQEPGDIMRRLRELEQEVAELRTARRLESASIGAGGMRVLDGSVTVTGGAFVVLDVDGEETLRLSTDGMELQGLLQVSDGGDIVVAGGALRILDLEGDDQLTLASSGLTMNGLLRILGSGAGFEVEDESGQRRLAFGIATASGVEHTRLGYFAEDGTNRVVIGEVVLDGSVDADGLTVRSADNHNIFRAQEAVSGQKRVWAGDSVNGPIDHISLFGESSTFIGTEGAFLESRVGGQVVLYSPDFHVYTSYQNTSDSANCRLTNDGRIQRSTSAARFKQDIEDLAVDPSEVLALRPRTWRDRGDVAQDPETDRWHVGLIAEEVIEAGLEEFVDFDPDGNPDSVAYDRLVVALIPLLRKLANGEPIGPRRGRKHRKPRRRDRRTDRRITPPGPPGGRAGRREDDNGSR